MRFKNFLKKISEAEMPYSPKIDLKGMNWQGAAGTLGNVVKKGPIISHDRKTTKKS